ncbi:hypothetical protein ACFL9T_12060, partial [Thermodesulfobacteriota bacterium]
NLLMSEPMRLEMLLRLFSTSQFLADTMVRNPGFMDWVIIPEMLNRIRRKEEMEREFRKAASVSRSHREWLNRLRRLRRREILRIGTRDICLGVSTRDIMLEISNLAEACIQVAIEVVFKNLKEEEEHGWALDGLEDYFCIMALGKLGGDELNYSSDIDLLGIWDDTAPMRGREPLHFYQELYTLCMQRVRSDLSEHTEEGYAYRVDLRLRPFGRSGELVSTVRGLTKYYREIASTWEIQAALKMRPVAGNLKLGDDFVKTIRPVLLTQRRPRDIIRSVQKMRKKTVKVSAEGPASTIDVKTGLGGIRDIEFLVQGMQLIHGPNNPLLLEGNTLNALDILQNNELLEEDLAEKLKSDYIFLRRVEHYLQILEDRQNHALPSDPQQLAALAKRMLGPRATPEQFMELLKECLARVHGAYQLKLLSGSA